MKFFKYLIFLLFTLNSIYAQWTRLPGPKGTDVTVLYSANGFLFAGTKSIGIYRTSNNGLSWSPANLGIENCQVNDIIASGSIILAAVSSSCPGTIGVYKSTDNGLHWTISGSGLPARIPESFTIKGSYI